MNEYGYNQIIAYNPDDYTEAPHIFVSASNVFDVSEKIASTLPSKTENLDTELIIKQYNDLNLIPPDKSKIQTFIFQQKAVAFLYEKLFVISVNPLILDVRHYDSILEKTFDVSTESLKPKESSLQIPKPKLLLESTINRFGNPIGLVVGETMQKENDILKLVISTRKRSVIYNREGMLKEKIYKS